MLTFFHWMVVVRIFCAFLFCIAWLSVHEVNDSSTLPEKCLSIIFFGVNNWIYTHSCPPEFIQKPYRFEWPWLGAMPIVDIEEVISHAIYIFFFEQEEIFSLLICLSWFILLSRLTQRRYLPSLYFLRQCHIDWMRARAILTMIRCFVFFSYCRGSFLVLL